MNALNKAPDKQGIISDSTTLKGPTDIQKDKWKADAEAKLKAETEAVAAKKAAEEKAKQAALATKRAEPMPPAALPPAMPKAPDPLAKPITPVALDKPAIGALPKMDMNTAKPALANAPALPGAPSLAMPAAPAETHTLTLRAPQPQPLPELTAITGDDALPNSIDLVQPKDSIESKPLAGSAPAPAPKLPPVPGSSASGLPVVKRGEAAAAKPALPAMPAVAAALPGAKPALPKPPLALPEPPAAVKSQIPVVAAVKPPAAMLPPVLATNDKTTQVALATPTAPVAGNGKLETAIKFTTDKADLTGEAKAALDGIAEKVKQSQGSVRIVGYASGDADSASVARRLSNTRALQVRAFLLSKGVNPLAINVQALGNQESADRADIFVK